MMIPTSALAGPIGGARKPPKSSLAEGLGAINGFEEEDAFLDVGGQQCQIEELGDVGADEAEAAGEVGAVLKVAAIDGGLESVSKGEHAGDMGGAADRLRDRVEAVDCRSESRSHRGCGRVFP